MLALALDFTPRSADLSRSLSTALAVSGIAKATRLYFSANASGWRVRIDLLRDRHARVAKDLESLKHVDHAVFTGRCRPTSGAAFHRDTYRCRPRTAPGVRMLPLHALSSFCTSPADCSHTNGHSATSSGRMNLIGFSEQQTLLGEVSVRSRERREQRVERRVPDRLVALLERRTKLDQLCLRDLHERRAVEHRSDVELHPALVLVVRSLILDCREPGIERVARVRFESTAGGRSPALIRCCVTRCSASVSSASRRVANVPT